MRTHLPLAVVLFTLVCLLTPSDLAGRTPPPTAPGSALAFSLATPAPPPLRFSGEITVLWQSSFDVKVFDPAYRPARPLETMLVGFDGRLRPCVGVPGARTVAAGVENPGVEPAGAGFLVRWPAGGGVGADVWAWCAG